MKLYHGSTVVVKQPNIRIGRKNTDFGKGFYTTTDIEQAKKWSGIKKQREEENNVKNKSYKKGCKYCQRPSNKTKFITRRHRISRIDRFAT